VTRADLVGETVEDRCPACAKKLMVDIGPNLFGHDSGVFWCPNCQAAPQVSALDAANIRAVVAVVVAARTTRSTS
jgi:hypothetical protein